MPVIFSSPCICCMQLHNLETFGIITSPYEAKNKHFLLLQIEGHKSSSVRMLFSSKSQLRIWTLDSGFELLFEINPYHVFNFLVFCDDSYLA